MIEQIVYQRAGVEPGERLPAYTSLGGYPLYYLTVSGDVLCPACANSPEAREAEAWDKEWRVTAVDIHYEGEPLECQGCGNTVESAYGPVEETSEDPKL